MRSDKTDDDKLRKGIAAYDRQQMELLDALKQHGGRLTQQQFDEEFSNARPMGIVSLSDDTLILGGIGQGQWARWLDLLQVMATLGMVSVRGTPPNLVYELR